MPLQRWAPEMFLLWMKPSTLSMPFKLGLNSELYSKFTWISCGCESAQNQKEKKVQKDPFDPKCPAIKVSLLEAWVDKSAWQVGTHSQPGPSLPAFHPSNINIWCWCYLKVCLVLFHHVQSRRMARAVLSQRGITTANTLHHSSPQP